MAEVLRWGIVGTGFISSRFATDLKLVPDAEVVAVGSRTRASAEEFGESFGVPNRHEGITDLVYDEDVDAVYVGNPHPMHYDTVVAALDAGKAVLVEKAFTVTAAQAQDLVDRARSKGLFMMEAMWTRFLPHIVRLRELLAEGVLGDIRTLSADHGQWFVRDDSKRLLNPALGGGAILDLGVYPISFASMVLGTPSSVVSHTDLAHTGVDATSSIVLTYDEGRQALISCTMEAKTPTTAAISGTEARIEIDGDFYQPSSFSLITRDGQVERFSFPKDGLGLRFQAMEVARCLREGLTESPIMPLDETVSIMKTMDEVRFASGSIALPGDDFQ